MAESFNNSDSRCTSCGDLAEYGSHLSYRVTSRIHLCDTCRKNENFAITDVPSSDQKGRVCDEHSDRIVELFCCTCKREICMMCGVTSHALHEKLELKKVFQNRQLDVEEQRKHLKTREDELLKLQTFAVKSLDRMEQRFESVTQDVNTSATESMSDIENVRQQKEDKIRTDTQMKVKEIEIFMESQLKCNNIEAQNDTKRVQDAKDSNIQKLSVLRDIVRKKTSIVTTAVVEKTSGISSVLEGLGMAKRDGQGTSLTLSAAEDETRERAVADNTPSPVLMMKALEQLGSHVDQVVWATDHKEKLNDNLVSAIWTPRHEYTLKHKPSPCCYITGNTMVYIDVASGSLYEMDLQNGRSQPISQSNGNYTDCVSVGKDIMTFENMATELQYAAHLSQLELDKSSEAKTVIKLDQKTDEPVAVHAAVNKKGVIMVAYDGSDCIIKVTGHSDIPVNIIQKTIKLKDKKICGKLHATPSGKFVIDTGRAEFTVMNEYGTVNATICQEEWGFALCGTDPIDDILYVSYQPEGSDVVRIDEVALDGTVRRKGVVEYRVTGMFSDPIVTSTGLLAIRDGQKIRVYKRTPFTSVLSTLDMLPTS